MGGLIGYYAFNDDPADGNTGDPIDSITGLKSPFRYNCTEFKCTALDDYVWRNNDDYRYGCFVEQNLYFLTFLLFQICFR